MGNAKDGRASIGTVARPRSYAPFNRSRTRAAVEAVSVSICFVVVVEYALARGAAEEIARTGQWLHRVGAWRVRLTDKDALITSAEEPKAAIAVLTATSEVFAGASSEETRARAREEFLRVFAEAAAARDPEVT